MNLDGLDASILGPACVAGVIVLSTHVLSEVEAICDRAIIINRGRIVAQDTMESLARSTSRIRLVVARPEPGLQQELEGLADVHRVSFDGERTFQIDAAADIREAVANVAVSRGLLELGSQRGLEDVFLRLTRQESGTPMEQP